MRRLIIRVQLQRFYCHFAGLKSGCVERKYFFFWLVGSLVVVVLGWFISPETGLLGAAHLHSRLVTAVFFSPPQMHFIFSFSKLFDYKKKKKKVHQQTFLGAYIEKQKSFQVDFSVRGKMS